jgi:hypothetical protein
MDGVLKTHTAISLESPKLLGELEIAAVQGQVSWKGYSTFGSVSIDFFRLPTPSTTPETSTPEKSSVG